MRLAQRFHLLANDFLKNNQLLSSGQAYERDAILAQYSQHSAEVVNGAGIDLVSYAYSKIMGSNYNFIHRGEEVHPRLAKTLAILVVFVVSLVYAHWIISNILASKISVIKSLSLIKHNEISFQINNMQTFSRKVQEGQLISKKLDTISYAQLEECKPNKQFGNTKLI